MRLEKRIRYHPTFVNLYDRYLDLLCRDVEAYVFVATTGRSGSETLARVFDAAESAACFHEPEPIMYRDYPPGMDRNSYFDDLFQKKKRIRIKRSAAGKKYYVETNHQFVKNFAGQAIACFKEKVRVIHLVRDPAEVAKSFFEIASVPGKTRTGKLYLLDPGDDDNRIDLSDILLRDPHFSHDLYRCLWYWYEIQARTKEVRERYSNLAWHTIRTEELNRKESLAGMFHALRINVDENKLESVVGLRANTRFGRKVKQADIRECRRMDEALRKEIRKRYDDRLWDLDPAQWSESRIRRGIEDAQSPRRQGASRGE